MKFSSLAPVTLRTLVVTENWQFNLENLRKENGKRIRTFTGPEMENVEKCDRKWGHRKGGGIGILSLPGKKWLLSVSKRLFCFLSFW